MVDVKTLGAFVLAILLAGCGGGGGEGAAPDADELAAQLDCTGDSDDEPDSVSCETEDAFYGITVYEDNDARDADVEVATSAGVAVLVGDRFLIDASDPAALELAQERVGGDVKGG